jgi:EmrB/QacA subfamily drug resistance transporter
MEQQPSDQAGDSAPVTPETLIIAGDSVTSAAPVAMNELSRKRRIGILIICSMSLLIVGMDITIVNVALPAIGRGFHASVPGLQWTIDAYTLVLGSLLMLSGSTADRLGRRRTFIIGLSVFSFGSLLCSLAPNLELLVVFRMLQAVGGSMLNPVAMSIITNTFTNPRERAQAVGVWGAVVGVSLALGPILGGILVSSAGWRSIFWINIPIGMLAIILALSYIPESKAPRARKIDPVGQVLVIVLLASLTYAIIEAPNRGWGSPLILVCFALALTSLLGLLRYELRRHEPLIELRFFRSIPFAAATVTAIAASATFVGFLFMNTLYLQEVRGLSALHAGLDTLPMAVMAMIMSPVSGRIVGRRGSRLPLVVAGATMGASCVMLSNIGAATSFTWLFCAYAVFGIGFGLVNVPITNAAVSGMPRAQAGVAASIASTSRQIGQTLGVAVIGALITSQIHGNMHRYLAPATHVGWWILSGCGLVVVILGAVATSRRALESARQTAEALNPEALIGYTNESA